MGDREHKQQNGLTTHRRRTPADGTEYDVFFAYVLHAPFFSATSDLVRVKRYFWAITKNAILKEDEADKHFLFPWQGLTSRGISLGLGLHPQVVPVTAPTYRNVCLHRYIADGSVELRTCSKHTVLMTPGNIQPSITYGIF